MWPYVIAFVIGFLMTGTGAAMVAGWRHRQRRLQESELNRMDFGAVRARALSTSLRLHRVGQATIAEILNQLWDEREGVLKVDVEVRSAFSDLLKQIVRVMDDNTTAELFSATSRHDYMKKLIMEFLARDADDHSQGTCEYDDALTERMDDS